MRTEKYLYKLKEKERKVRVYTCNKQKIKEKKKEKGAVPVKGEKTKSQNSLVFRWPIRPVGLLLDINASDATCTGKYQL